MGVIYGQIPEPPQTITEDVLRGMRLRGSRPCGDGLGQALEWLDGRALPIGEALEEVEGVLEDDDVDWALHALGVSGSGSGDGDGYGHGYGSGSGYGSGYGHGYGYGHGDGYGYGYGDGSGDGDGYGSGHGYGDGDGSGHGYGSGY